MGRSHPCLLRCTDRTLTTNVHTGRLVQAAGTRHTPPQHNPSCHTVRYLQGLCALTWAAGSLSPGSHLTSLTCPLTQCTLLACNLSTVLLNTAEQHTVQIKLNTQPPYANIIILASTHTHYTVTLRRYLKTFKIENQTGQVLMSAGMEGMMFMLLTGLRRTASYVSYMLKVTYEVSDLLQCYWAVFLWQTPCIIRIKINRKKDFLNQL